VGRVLFFLSESFRALRRSAAPSVAAIVTIVITTLLLGVLIPVLRASESSASNVSDQIGLRVFLYRDATQAQIDALQKKLDTVPHVTEATYCSPECAQKRLAANLQGDLKEGIQELNSNPLPPSFDLALDDPDNLEAVRSSLTPPNEAGKPTPISPAIEPPIGASRDQAKQIREVTGAVKIVLLVIAGLLLVASLLLVANTIRLSIYARRREVEVMQLVGATDWFIRWPFMIEGVIVGVAGAGIAVGILWLGKVTIVDPLADNFALVDNLSTTGFVPLVAMLVAAAVLVSALGSGITLRRFLRV
jgi:cell division transport system permease protein